MDTTAEKSAVKIAAPPAELEREPLVLNNRSLGWISDRIAGICENQMPKWWLPTFIISVLGTIMMFSMLVYLVTTGVGVWGLNQPVDWAWDITNFVFWIGIGDLGGLVPPAPEMAYLHQSRGGGDDAVRRGLRRYLPGVPYGSRLVRFVARFPVPVPER
jgi:hypothetical protein